MTTPFKKYMLQLLTRISGEDLLSNSMATTSQSTAMSMSSSSSIPSIVVDRAKSFRSLHRTQSSGDADQSDSSLASFSCCTSSCEFSIDEGDSPTIPQSESGEQSNTTNGQSEEDMDNNPEQFLVKFSRITSISNEKDMRKGLDSPEEQQDIPPRRRKGLSRSTSKQSRRRKEKAFSEFADISSISNARAIRESMEAARSSYRASGRSRKVGLQGKKEAALAA